MDTEIISKIVKAERGIERRVEEERAKASQWLEGIKRDAEAKLKAEEEDIKKAYSGGTYTRYCILLCFLIY